MFKKCFIAAAVVSLLGSTNYAAFSEVYDGFCVGPVMIESAEPNGWQISARRIVCEEGLEEMEISLVSSAPAVPPKFTVSFDIAQGDILHKWSTKHLEKVTLPPDWYCRTYSRLCSEIPLVSLLNGNDRNRATVSCSEAMRLVYISAGLHEEDCRLTWKIRYFDEPEAPITKYTTRIRFDRRDIFFGEAIASGVKWMGEAAGFRSAPVPEDAFEPLYSSWYAFHQDVTDKKLEVECAEAAKLGMKTLIVDDGWQTDDTNRGYAFCGDWNVSTNRFPNFAAHVAKVQAMGMKYLIWYGVPMIGFKSANYDRFKGKYLAIQDHASFAVLDPRFPEVRAFICETYARAMKEWGLDGMKLDYVDSFEFKNGVDPAVAENYAGRDIKSLPQAVDRLMKDVYATLISIKPNALVEFRQSYIGPGIRQYGNIMRATDCPGDATANRCRIANLRLICGDSAVHSDMLEWSKDTPPEVAARQVLSSIFGVIQYSVLLTQLPEEQKRMVSHWLAFSKAHRETLLKGAFRPHHYAQLYSLLEGESVAERIIGVYGEGLVADCGAADKDVYVLNATETPKLTLRLATSPKAVEIYDTFGNKVAAPSVRDGLQDVAVPLSGYVKIVFGD